MRILCESSLWRDILFLMVSGLLPACAISNAAAQNCGEIRDVVPGACIGQFRHGSLVKKTGSGVNEAIELATSAAQATNTHPGVDLVADCGSPIYALADGLVIDAITDKAEPDFRYLGYFVELRHPYSRTGLILPETPFHETETLYLHMQEPPLVKRGSVVLKGTQLGVVGRTGAAWGCHTHFEVRHFHGRFQSKPAWNSPPNIYGRGDQTGTKLFADNWTDPLDWLDHLPQELVAPTSFTLSTSVQASELPSPALPTLYIDPGACPGEYCRYGNVWTTKTATPVYPSFGATVKEFTLAAGHKVTTIKGIVATKPGRIALLHPVLILGHRIDSGDLYVLTYKGEGFWKIWWNHRIIDSVELEGTSFPLTVHCTPSTPSCLKKVVSQGLGSTPIIGQMIEEPQGTWWIEVRDEAGRTGWITVPSFTWSGLYGIN